MNYLIPLITAGLNRRWRGEAQAPRWAWYGFMTLLAWVQTFDAGFTAIWLFFLICYAMPPWQAMFSAINGAPPSRKDHWLFQWMQEVAWDLCRPVSGDFTQYGVTYGAIRASLLLAPILLLVRHFNSPTLLPLFGTGFLLMGWIYYQCGRLCRYWTGNNALAVSFAEIIMGYFIGAYLETLCSIM